jgi:hypothetical protein
MPNVGAGVPLRPSPTTTPVRERLDWETQWLPELTRTPRDLNAAEIDKLRRSMSATPPGWRESTLREFKNWRGSDELSIKIKAGGEWERSDIRLLANGVDANLGPKVSIGSLRGHDLQTDDHAVQVGQEIYTYEESVQIPEDRRKPFVDNVVGGPGELGDRLFDATFRAKRKTGNLRDIAAGVKPEFSHLTFEVKQRGIPIGPTDFSSGTTERDYPRMVEENPNAKLPEAHTGSMKFAVLAAERQLKAWAKQAGMPQPEITPRLRGFLSSVVAAEIEAGLPLPDGRNVQTAHNYFLYEPRTTYTWRYYLNLDSQERAVARGLLLKLSDGLPTALSHGYKELMGNGGSQPLNSMPYDSEHDQYLWPSHDEFHESIIHGTPGAPMHDALTNLKGYGPGKGIGAWGVGYIHPSGNLDKNVAGFTRNGSEFMPSSNVYVNMAEQEYDFFARFNPNLEKVTPEVREASQKAFDNAVKLSVAAAGFNSLYGRLLSAQEDDPANGGTAIAKAVQGTGIDMTHSKSIDKFQFGRSWTPMHQALADLKPLVQLIAETKSDPKWADLRKANEDVLIYLKRDPASVDSKELESRLDRLGEAMFDCDGYGGGRLERQKAVTQV